VIRGEIEQKGGNVDFRQKVVDDFDGEMVVHSFQAANS